MTTFDLPIQGMTCASCAGRVERALRKLPQVSSVSVNLASERAHLQLLGTADPQALLAAVVAAGYQASLLNAEEPPAADPSQPLQRERWSLLLALGLALPLLLPMLAEPFGLHWMQPAWLQFALATPVQFIFGARFYRAGWSAVRAGSANGLVHLPERATKSASTTMMIAVRTSVARSESTPWMPILAKIAVAAAKTDEAFQMSLHGGLPFLLSVKTVPPGTGIPSRSEDGF